MRAGTQRLKTPALGLLMGYVPLVAIGVGIFAMVLLVPSEVPDGGEPDGGESDAIANTASDDAAGSRISSDLGEGVEPCEDRDRQVPDSGYSPPCFTFSGDNGGATAPGVTEDTIKISYRHLQDAHMAATFSRLADVPLGESAEDMWEAVEGLVDYFNENFELYGRKLEVERFDGNGSLSVELLGAGQENANVDARRAVDLDVFADVSGFTQPYSEALADREIITIGVPFMSREWFQERAPYAWSNFPSCTWISESATELVVDKILDEPAAFAGGDLANRPRTYAIIFPNTTEYTTCGRLAERMVRDAGHDVEIHSYTIGDTNHATSILAQLRDEEITTVACGCDPLMMQALARQAEQQSYQPEWYMVSTGYVDWELVGQAITHGSGDQWGRAFGATPSASPAPFGDSEAYRAFKSVRPDEEPSQFVDMPYTVLYRLAIGIQMAGPNLTPETFQQGMYDYPGGSGAMGAWEFSPDNHPGTADARLVYWDLNERSPFNGRPGTYVDVGERFTDPDEAPSHEDLVDAIGSGP